MKTEQSKSIPLKEIVGFLPYDLDILVTSIDGEEKLPFTGILRENGFEIIQISNTDYYLDSDENEFKMQPIVRPISDLTKEITHNGEKIKPYEILFPVDEFDKLMDWTSLKCAEEFLSHEERLELCYPMEFWDKLKELHFDIYDWIKDGLAIDLNTLNKDA